MLQLGTTRTGYAIAASDGAIGTVRDVLFDDQHWRVRWLVVDTGSWLSGRKVLIHPSALGQADEAARAIPAGLTMAQVRASPDILEHEPVSAQMEQNLYGYYGWDPGWGGLYPGGNAIALPFSAPSYFGDAAVMGQQQAGAAQDESDPHLRSLAEVNGYRIEAADGEIGHLSDVMIDESGWRINYLVVATRNWWPGKHVLVSPNAVTDIDWSERRILVNVSREKIKSSPAWDSTMAMDRSYTDKVNAHYGW